MGGRKIEAERIQQGDIIVLALELAEKRRNGWISTSDLRAAMVKKFKPNGPDADLISSGYSMLFEQIVRNIVSNKKTKRSIFSMKYAEHVDDGIKITDLGREFLKSVPR